MPVFGGAYSPLGPAWGASATVQADPDIAERARHQILVDRPGLANQRDIAGMQANTALQQAQIGAQASTLPARLQHQRWGATKPLLQGQMAQFAPGGSAHTAGPAGPHITVGGVWNPAQIQGQVNQMRAGNDQRLATQNTQAAQQTAGRGFGSNSPLLQALYGQNQASNLAANTQGEQATRWNAASGNREMLLNTQQGAANVFGQRQQEDIQRRGQNLGSYNALIAALAGIV